MDNYSLAAKCKKPGSTAIISLDAVKGFVMSGKTLSYQGPPILHPCEACGGMHSYTMKDVHIAPKTTLQ